MLTTLRIKNLALVADLTLELQPGFNAITGETGAGKSILIGALNLVLGERADRTLIRSGSDSCTVEAAFDVSHVDAPWQQYLADNGLESCEDNTLVVKRVFSVAGANRQFINGTPTSLNVLGEVGEWLVDIHGPHDHQSLLHPSRQLAILDAYGRLGAPREAFARLVQHRLKLEGQKAGLIVDDQTYAQQLDLFRFQAHEITAAQLKAGEDATLETEYQRAQNAAKLLQSAQTALGFLSDEENAILSQTGLVGRALQDLHRLDSGASHLVALHEQAANCLGDLQTELARYLDRLEVDPQRLRELEERLNLIHSLKRKYGRTVEEVIGFGEQAKEKFRQLEEREVELSRLQDEIKRLEAEIWHAGQELSAQRCKVAPQLCKAVLKQLAELGFKHSGFEIQIDSVTAAKTGANPPVFSTQGLDKVDFQFAPNVGEPPRPLRAIASSGEMARIMLALKTVLAVEDSIPVLVFDEVDANVGGETAAVVGEKMRQIGRRRQVLCITHLAPVAACAATHYRVNKQVRDGRTISEIVRLEKEERVTELARMLGGQSGPVRQHAQALLNLGDQTK